MPGNCSTDHELITAPENGEVTVTSHRYGGSAIYKCNGGFTLVGDAVRNCIEGGNSVQWNGSKPQCSSGEFQ